VGRKEGITLCEKQFAVPGEKDKGEGTHNPDDGRGGKSHRGSNCAREGNGYGIRRGGGWCALFIKDGNQALDGDKKRRNPKTCA